MMDAARCLFLTMGLVLKLLSLATEIEALILASQPWKYHLKIGWAKSHSPMASAWGSWV